MMPALRLPRLSLRRVSALIVSFTIIAAVFCMTFYIALPMRRAHYLELDYQRRLLSSTSVRPLIEDIDQLFFWTIPGSKFQTWDDLLLLNHDGTAIEYGAGGDMWIYLAGTAPDSRQKPNAYMHEWKKPDCKDPEYICDMYLDAFIRISRRWPGHHVPKRSGSPPTLLRWVDCDVSPMLCSSFWGLSGVNVLVHMKTYHDCDYSMLPDGSCPVTWQWFGLPIYQAPWTRQIRIPLDRGGSTVVPAFPSAEEQMWNIMAYEGATKGMDYDDKTTYPPKWNSMSNVTPQPGLPPGVDVLPLPFSSWGGFRDTVDNPWDQPEWPYEIEIKCYIERYTDILLRWWDGAMDIVKPRSCVNAVEEKCKERRVLREYTL